MFDLRMVGQAQIVIIGKADEMLPTPLGGQLQTVGGRAVRMAMLKHRFTGEPEALQSIFGEAIVFLHQSRASKVFPNRPKS